MQFSVILAILHLFNKAMFNLPKQSAVRSWHPILHHISWHHTQITGSEMYKTCIDNIALPLQNGSSCAHCQFYGQHQRKKLHIQRNAFEWLTNGWKFKPIHHYTFCSKCGNPKLLHVLCGHCFKETMKLTAEYCRMKEQECKEDDVLNQEHNTVSTKQNS